MKIDKVLNNNVVISHDENNQEIVVMGRGIGFKQKAGMDVDKNLIQKIFTLQKDDDKNEYFKELLNKIPPELISITNDIIKDAEEELNTKFHQSIYIALADHLYFAVDRLLKGTSIKNVLLFDIQRLYPLEYKAALRSIQTIKERSGISFSEDEASFIAMHFVNSQLNDDMNNTINATTMIRDIIKIIRFELKQDVNEQSEAFTRLVIHLRYFAHRLMHNEEKKIFDSNDNLINEIERKCSQSFNCTQKIANYIRSNYGHELSSEEKLFLTIHIERVKKQ